MRYNQVRCSPDLSRCRFGVPTEIKRRSGAEARSHEGILHWRMADGDRRQSSAYPSRRRPGMPTIPASSGHGPAACCGRGIGMEYECDLIQIRNRLEQQVLLALPPFPRRGVARRKRMVSCAGVGSRRDHPDAVRDRGSSARGPVTCPGIRVENQSHLCGLSIGTRPRHRNPFPITSSDAPMSAATASHMLAWPVTAKIRNITFNPMAMIMFC